MSDASKVVAGQVPANSPEREIRFAVVMYGGVSLAIYMHGVTQELLHMVRATARGVGGIGPAKLGQGQLRLSEKVYRRLSHRLEGRKANLDDAGPVRFVVDIMSGTSAGGINGVYLAKALANDQSLDGLNKLWRSKGDIDTLLNDSRSLVGMPGSLRIDPRPQSLLNSQRMYLLLLDAFEQMSEGQGAAVPPPSPYMEQLDLYVTTTDVRGLPLPIQLFDRPVWERRFRNFFHFSYAGPSAASQPHNDFEDANDPFLAFAARATSSFPFAFEPTRLCDIETMLAALPAADRPQISDQLKLRWQDFYEDYHKPVDNLEFEERSFGDGGYLNNKPFSYATESLGNLSAERPVSRKLIYLEPSPEHPELQPTPPGKPDVVENIAKALVELPLQQTIRDDLVRIAERNRLLERVDRITSGLDSDIAKAPGVLNRLPAPPPNWVTLDLADMVNLYGLGYVAYHRLKIADATDDLAGHIADLSGIEEDSDRFETLRELVRVWRDEHYVKYHNPAQPNAPTQNQFVMDFNFGYRSRRLRFLLQKISELEQLDGQAIDILEQAGVVLDVNNAGWPNGFINALQAARRSLSQIMIQYLRDASPLHKRPDVNDPLYAPVTGLNMNVELHRVMQSPLTPQLDSQVADLYRTCGNNLDALATALAARLRIIYTTAFNACSVAFATGAGLNAGAQAVGQCLNFYFDHFDDYDSFLYPLLYGTDGAETHQVAIGRISPEDAIALFDATKCGCRKLGGDTYGHFGAFLDRLWRDNDILWGRLDGAERLIRMLVADTSLGLDEITQIILEAQAAIVAEELEGRGADEAQRLLVEGFMRPQDGQPADDALRSFIANLTAGATDPVVQAKLSPHLDEKKLLDRYHVAFKTDRRPEPELLLRSSARATVIIGKILDGISERFNGHGKKLAMWVTQFGRAFWAMVELAVPRSLLNLSSVHWLGLFYLCGLVVAVGGFLLGQGPVGVFGLWILSVTFGIQMLIRWLNRAMRRLPTHTWQVLRVAGIVLLLLILIAVLLMARLEWPHLQEDLKSRW